MHDSPSAILRSPDHPSLMATCKTRIKLCPQTRSGVPNSHAGIEKIGNHVQKNFQKVNWLEKCFCNSEVMVEAPVNADFLQRALDGENLGEVNIA